MQITHSNIHDVQFKDSLLYHLVNAKPRRTLNASASAIAPSSSSLPRPDTNTFRDRGRDAVTLAEWQANRLSANICIKQWHIVLTAYQHTHTHTHTLHCTTPACIHNYLLTVTTTLSCSLTDLLFHRSLQSGPRLPDLLFHRSLQTGPRLPENLCG